MPHDLGSAALARSRPCTESNYAAPGVDAGMHDVLQIGPLMPQLEAALKTRFTMHRFWEAPDKAALLARIAASTSAIVVNARHVVTSEVIQRLPNLRAIVTFGVGADGIAIEAARQRGIQISNTPSVSTDCVADHAIGLLIDASRSISLADRFVRRGDWYKGPAPLGKKVTGKRLGIVGLGNIGRAVAQRASGFLLDVRYYGRRAHLDCALKFEADLLALARWADFLVVTIAGGPSTTGLISRDVIDALGPDGILVNVSRGSVVDQDALLAALRHKRLYAAALDVFVDEPNVPADLLDLDNVVLTPHYGSGTRETRAEMADLVLENLSSFFATGKLITPIQLGH